MKVERYRIKTGWKSLKKTLNGNYSNGNAEFYYLRMESRYSEGF